MSGIGILTFHNNENRGAILQSYALQYALQEVFSEPVDVVEYRTESKEKRRRNAALMTKRPWRLPRRLKDRYLVESFISEELSTSSESIVTDDHGRAVDWIENQPYDLLVTGSDEIWKTSQDSEGGFLSRFLPDRPFPNLYYLDPRLSVHKVAYAASANKLDPTRIDEEHRKKMVDHLSAYDFISVRDAHTEALLENLGISPIDRVPDPTILVDIPSRDVKPILRKRGVDLDEKILGYHGPGHPVFKEICESYREKGYQIVTPHASPYADIDLKGKLEPFEYYSLYEHFDMVVTNSLHSTIFSIKHDTPFATVDIDDRYGNLQSKTHSLLSDFDLLERYVDAVDGDSSEFFDNQDDIEQPLEKEHVENQISQQKNRGFEFLKRVNEYHETND